MDGKNCKGLELEKALWRFRMRPLIRTFHVYTNFSNIIYGLVLVQL